MARNPVKPAFGAQPTEEAYARIVVKYPLEGLRIRPWYSRFFVVHQFKTQALEHSAIGLRSFGLLCTSQDSGSQLANIAQHVVGPMGILQDLLQIALQQLALVLVLLAELLERSQGVRLHFSAKTVS